MFATGRIPERTKMYRCSGPLQPAFHIQGCRTDTEVACIDVNIGVGWLCTPCFLTGWPINHFLNLSTCHFTFSYEGSANYCQTDSDGPAGW